MPAVTTTDLPGLRLLNRGKVRDIYEVDREHLLLVATDRISAFDVVLPGPVPDKGIVLTQLSLFWFDLLQEVTPGHVVEADPEHMPPQVREHAPILRGRSLLVRRAAVHPVECIIRGYLLGSAWKDYRTSGRVCGIPLPGGLEKNHRFDPPLFTPSTKAESGHDENITLEDMAALLGDETARDLERRSLEVFTRAAEHARERGIVLCDTKLEWGRAGGRTLLVDEVLTPDSSRFWLKEEADRMLPAGGDPAPYDKQLVREYLETLDWDKSPPGPELPEDVLRLTRERYLEIYQRITGRPVPYLD